MKDLTIAQAQANVEARIAGEKRKGERKRKPRQSAVQKAVVAEVKRLEQLQAAVAIGAVDSHIGEQMSRHRHATGSPTRKSTKNLLAEWARRNGADPLVPRRSNSLNKVVNANDDSAARGRMVDAIRAEDERRWRANPKAPRLGASAWTEPKRPQSLAEVNRMLLKLKRQAQMLERECVMLQQEVFRLQRNGGKHD